MSASVGIYGRRETQALLWEPHTCPLISSSRTHDVGAIILAILENRKLSLREVK